MTLLKLGDNKLTKNLDAYTIVDDNNLTEMTLDELDNYEYNLDYGTGNLSDEDHIRAYYTLKLNLKKIRGI